jgi:outer membrane immunogenic protein
MVGAAAAADLPARMVTKAPPLPPPPPMYNWTGFYTGVNVGGSWGHQDTALVAGGAAVVANSSNINGIIGGGQVGYNWQGMGSPWVFGVEADIQGSGQNADASFVTPATGVIAVFPGFNIAYSDSLDWFGTLRGRVGWAMGTEGRFLPYITGGLAYGQGTINGAGTLAGSGAAVAFSNTHTYFGWTAGAGVEWAFWNRWSAKLEYLYVDFGNGPTIALSPAVAITSNHMTDNIVRVGANYHF